MSIRLAVFDIAGTTVTDKNFVAIAFKNAFAAHGMEITEEETIPLMGYHKPLAIQMMLEKLEIDPDTELIEEIHADFESEMIDFYEYAPEVMPMPGAEEAFLALKEKGIRIALNTGFSREIADAIVNRFEWKEKGLVDDYIGSNEVEKGRPYVYMISELMKRAGVSDAREVIKIGDTAVDIEEGKNAGCKYVIGVTTGAFAQAELEEQNPTHILHHLSELPAILQ
ncbi:MAG: HAD hydrolase-like protein [Chitinophagaceae bacterium]|nr:HAD hydrolase-like protein [Chitinophagaceae bacterium]